MWLFVIFCIIVVTIIFPYMWIVILVGLFVIFPICSAFRFRDEERRQRQERARKRRYGDDYDSMFS